MFKFSSGKCTGKEAKNVAKHFFEIRKTKFHQFLAVSGEEKKPNHPQFFLQ
jgi:hypothetical protein